MRKWVEYDFDKDRVISLDQKRLIKCAEIFQQECARDSKGYGVEEINNLYLPYVIGALSGEIIKPQHDLPYTYTMKEMLLPDKVEDAVTNFKLALEGRPAVYKILDTDTIFNHREKYLKEEEGKIYILEYFDDED